MRQVFFLARLGKGEEHHHEREGAFGLQIAVVTMNRAGSRRSLPFRARLVETLSPRARRSLPLARAWPTGASDPDRGKGIKANVRYAAKSAPGLDLV